jgi:hypothetical protein
VSAADKRVRKFQPENKLAKAMDDPTGLLFGQALKRAAVNIEGVRDAHMAALEEKLDSLCLQAASAAGSREPEGLAELYRLAREILSDAGALRLKDISRAAHSLCELMTTAQNRKQLWAGIAVHVDAITALRRASNGNDAREAILAGLETISRS